MIYRTPETPACRLCANAESYAESGNIMCSVKGTVPADFACKNFKYDIFKRRIKPKPKRNIPKFKKGDFEI